MKSKVAGAKLSIYLAVMIFVAPIVPGAETASWVLGWQGQGRVGYAVHAFIGRYDTWLEGHPRAVSYSTKPISKFVHNLGNICSMEWRRNSYWNPQPDDFDFNCIPTPDEISANIDNVGFYIGGLNSNGVTIAQCNVTEQLEELCDSDYTWSKSCLTYLKCE